MPPALLLLAASADPRAAITGTWRGTSTCTQVRAACHDATIPTAVPHR